MKQLFYLILLVFLWSCATTSTSTETKPETYNFPADWLGSYEGELEMWNAERGALQKFPMQVKITETDTANRYRWWSKMVFNGKDIIKDYNIFRTDDMPPNHYLMDENNGIYLDRILLDNSFYDYFQVGNLGIYGITRRVPAGMTFEMASFQLASVTYSRYESNNAQVDSVASYKVTNTQKALLKRIDN